jgi:DNA-binding NarL/FixJ family response regulator
MVRVIGYHWHVGAEIRIVVVDDHRMLREGLRLLFDREEDCIVVGEAADGPGALECVGRTTPDVVILDIRLADENGLQLAPKLLAKRPELKVIILSARADGALVNDALRIGAAGYLCKEEASDELLRSVRTVMRGQVYLSPAAAKGLVDHLRSHPPTLTSQPSPAFSARELEVLKLVVEGQRNKEIAGRLGIGVKSVESYRARVMAKAGCSSPAELVRFALKEKLVNP